MNWKRALCLVLSSATCLSTACKTEHEHTWTSYIAKQPTCTENGIVERICSECSKQVFEPIQSVGHLYGEDGVCSVCGQNKDGSKNDKTEDSNVITIPQNADYGYTLQDIYDEFKELGYAYSYEEFFQIVCGEDNRNAGCIEGFYVDDLTFLHFNIVDEATEANFSFAVARDNLSAPDEKALKTIYRASLTSGELNILYSDGSTLDAGKIIAEDGEKQIRSVALSPKLQVFVTYSDDTARFVGKISDGIVPEANSSFIYEACTGGYAIKGVVDRNATHLEIPMTFRGQPVVKIKEYAFDSCKNLKYVIISENVTTIESHAFRPYGTEINLFFKGEEKNCSFAPHWKWETVTAYFKGEWPYVNGEPQAN